MLSACFMQDSKKYNEWMNIVDYETEEGAKDHEKYKKDLLQSGFTPAQFLERKRKLRQGGGTYKIHLLDVRSSGTCRIVLAEVFDASSVLLLHKVNPTQH